MRILLQRVKNASVAVDGEVVGEIEAGLLLFVGFCRDDHGIDVERPASRVVDLRVFPDRDGRLQHSLAETGGGVLAVPQFTLYAQTRRGRRPDFTEAMPPVPAGDLFSAFVEALGKAGVPRVESGRFGADMAVSLVNDGPFTLHLEFQCAADGAPTTTR